MSKGIINPLQLEIPTNWKFVGINIRPIPERTNTHAVLLCGYNHSEKILSISDPGIEENFRVFTYEYLAKVWSAFLSEPRGQSYHSGFIIYSENYNNK